MSNWEDSGKSDEWYTPKYIFDALECRFDMDVAAPVDRTFVTVPTSRFITENSLEMDWDGFVWCNPPFGARNGITPWIDKIQAHRYGILLTPDRTSAPWWKIAATGSHGVLFLSKKVKFIRPDGSVGKAPSTGTCLFGHGMKGVDHLKIAEKKGLGVFYKR